MALILDTARFKYPPHWVPLSMLYEAMAYEDPSTGKPRGFLKVMASRTLHSVLFALDCSVEDAKWLALRRWVDEDVKGIVQGFALGGEISSGQNPKDLNGLAEACSGMR
jgi:glutathione gamma-glutamylcysteinyltransferase